MHTDTSLLAPPLFPQTVTPATPQCHPRIQTEISSTHWSVLRTLLLPPRSQIEKRLCAFVRHPVDSQAVAFSDCTPVGFLKASNVQRLSENVPPKGLHGRFPNPGRTGCFQPPPERIPYVPPARASDNVCGKRHAEDCGPPPRGLSDRMASDRRKQLGRTGSGLSSPIAVQMTYLICA